MHVPDYCDLESCGKPVDLQSTDHAIVTHEVTREGIYQGTLEKNFHLKCASEYMKQCQSEYETKLQGAN